eukprot:gene4957-6930_t
MEWINLPDLSSFDCALCSHKYRKKILRIIRLSKNIVAIERSKVIMFSVSYWAWITQRLIIVDAINFTGAADLSIFLNNYYQKLINQHKRFDKKSKNICNYIKSIKIGDPDTNSQRFAGDEYLMKLGHLFPHLENLECLYQYCNDLALSCSSLYITKLKSLLIHSPVVTDIGISSILSANQSSLTQLSIYTGFNISGSDISPTLLTNLKELTLNRSRITGENFYRMSIALTGLIKLSLISVDNINDENLSRILLNVSNLKYLSIRFTTFTGHGMTGIIPQNLIELDLHGCYNIDSNGIIEIFSNNLTNLIILNMQWIQGEVTEQSLQNFPQNLLNLNLSRMNSLDEKGLTHILSCLNQKNQLKILKLSNNKRITGEESMKFLPNSLEELDLSYCFDISEQGLSQILSKNLCNLTILNVSNIRMESKNKLSTSLPPLPHSLTSLNLSSIGLITDNHLCQLFSTEMNNLTSLDLSHNSRIT